MGSFARGTSDQFSDVDLCVVVDETDIAAFCDDWPDLCDSIAPTVFRRQLGDHPVFNHITPDWLRFDVLVASPEALLSRTRTTVSPLYDPQGLSSRLAEPNPPNPPNPERISAVTVEFLRVLGLLPVVIGREEFVVGQSGVSLLRSMLIDLMLEDVAVEDRGGSLHLNKLLPPERQHVLTQLPPVQASRESVIAGHVACATAFLPLSRTLHSTCGLAWPQVLEDAARHHLYSTLSIEIPD